MNSTAPVVMTAEPIALPRAGQRFAARRLYRLMTMALSITTVVELASVTPVMLSQAETLGWPYTVSALVLILAPSIIALFLFSRAEISTLRIVWRTQTILMLLVYIGLPIALAGTRLSAVSGLTWTSELEVIAGCAAVLGWRLRGAAIAAAALQILMLSIAWYTSDNPARSVPFGDAIRQLFYVTMFMTLCAAMLRAGRILDSTVDRAVAEIQLSAEAERRRSGRQRVEMLIHDSVIVALLAYSSGAGPERSAEQAKAALDAIRSIAQEDHIRTSIVPRNLAWELQGMTTRLDPEVHFEYISTGSDAIPVDVSSAISDAYSEALRNSIRHASSTRPVTRQVHAAISAEEITISVLDDGDGFDLAAIHPARLGIRHGIFDRMGNLPGGSAEVRTHDGYGTIVTLRWVRP